MALNAEISIISHVIMIIIPVIVRLIIDSLPIHMQFVRLMRFFIIEWRNFQCKCISEIKRRKI